jgi:hypothetical protein
MPGYGMESNIFSLASAAARARAQATADAAPRPTTPQAPGSTSGSPLGINRAAIRASYINARVPQPAMAKEVDFSSAIPPTDAGIYVPPGQVAENRGVAARGQFQPTPEWKGVGGGLRSAAQMEQDLGAHALLNDTYRQGVGEAKLEEDVRGDPMSLATVARKKMLGYEDVLPADAQSRVRFGLGGPSLKDYASRAPDLGTPTMGEYRQNRSLIAQAAAKQDPAKVAEGATTMGRGRLAEELSILQGQLQDDVRAGRRTKDEAEGEWAKAVDKAMSMAQILKPTFPSQPDFNMGGPAPTNASK